MDLYFGVCGFCHLFPVLIQFHWSLFSAYLTEYCCSYLSWIADCVIWNYRFVRLAVYYMVYSIDSCCLHTNKVWGGVNAPSTDSTWSHYREVPWLWWAHTFTWLLTLFAGVKWAWTLEWNWMLFTPPFIPSKTRVIANNSCLSLTYHFQILSSIVLSLRFNCVDVHKTFIDA